MKILYIGMTETARLYHEGVTPGHWLYGAVEFERDGNTVIWEQEKSGIFNDIQLIAKHQPNLIFIPNLNLKSHLLLLTLSSLKIIRIPIKTWLHRTPPSGSKIQRIISRFLLKGIYQISFLSKKNREECRNNNLLSENQIFDEPWLPDVNYYSNIRTIQGERFVSTGKENRDFDLLIEAFRITGAPLTILTADSHAGADYSDLFEKCKGIPNIEVIITKNTGAVYPQMVEAMAKSKALVCPLKQDRLNYCVGLSTIADAEGLNKPLLITYNPYHDPERMTEFMQLNTLEDWIKAIKSLNE